MAGISAAGRESFVQLLHRGKRLVTVDDAASALSLGRREAAKRLAHWAATGWLRRVRRGLYIPVPLEAINPAAWSEDALYLADAVWEPCYFTGWTAASHWGLTEQVFQTTVLKTTQRVRSGSQRLLDHEYLVSHISAGLMWGLASLWRQDRRLQLANASRTVLDVLDEPSLAGGIRHAAEVLGAYLEDNDGEELVAYGDRLGNKTVFKRLGYLLETRHSERAGLIGACRQRVSSGFAALDPKGPPGGKLSTRWALRVNVFLEGESAS